MKDSRERPLVRDTPLDPLRNQLLDILDVALEVAVLRETTRAHGAEGAHASVLLEALALREDDVAGTLVRARQHRASHHAVRSSGDRLRDVARRRKPTVPDQTDAVPRRHLRAVVDRRPL